VSHAQPGDAPGEVGKAILDLGAGKGGGEFSIEALGGDLCEAIDGDPWEVKELNQEAGKVPVDCWDILGMEASAQSRQTRPQA
jgi:predicted RNA methylase